MVPGAESEGDVRNFGELENEIMRAVWRADGPVTGHQIAETIARERTLAYTTVITVVERLRSKQVLSRFRDGRSYRYEATLTSEEYAAVLMGQVLSDAENPSGALLRFAGTLDPVEAAALREALDVAAPAEDS